MITNNTNSFKTNVIMFFFLIAKDEFVHPISELGPSSAGPLFEPAREARGQERSQIKQVTINRPGVYLWYSKISGLGGSAAAPLTEPARKARGQGRYYVGSSINLYKRLSRYFQSSPGPRSGPG
jgi:hypothetical protein